MSSSMTSALSNMFSLDRQRARFRSDRIVNDEEQEGREVARVVDPEEQPTLDNTTTTTTTTPPPGQPPTPTAAPPSIRATRTSTSTSRNTAANTRDIESGSGGGGGGGDNDDDTDEEEEEANGFVGGTARMGGASTTATTATTGGMRNHPAQDIFFPSRMTLAELEEERELSRRRTSLCILLTSFVLFRLWVSAIQEGDFGLLLICLMATSGTARWISYNREREEELDRRISSFYESNTNGEGDAAGNLNGILDRNDMRMLSFQAQLALAIMESQRQMMQGGYGNPDGYAGEPGVSEAARAKWTHFAYTHPGPNKKDGGGAGGGLGRYGSVNPNNKDKDKDSSLLLGSEDEPHCSICLSEYEEGDAIVELPCHHLYHDECISSWTSNHTKCPLCNYNLESAASSTDGASTDANNSNNNNTAVETTTASASSRGRGVTRRPLASSSASSPPASELSEVV